MNAFNAKITLFLQVGNPSNGNRSVKRPHEDEDSGDLI